MKAKLSDVAARAGVSLTTVSRVINHDETLRIPKETEDKIWESVHELKYSVKPRKRNTSSSSNSRSKYIGYILTNDEFSFDDVFFADIIRGIENELTDKKCNLRFALTAKDFNIEELDKKYNFASCNGIIIIGNVPSQIYQYFSSQNIPIVKLFNEKDSLTCDLISISYEKAIYELVTELIKLGHRNIVYMGETTGFNIDKLNLYDYEDRFRGYLIALLSNKINISPDNIINISWDMETAYIKTKELLSEPNNITAICAASDKIAIGAMRAIQETGYSIPNDISITGCDNIEFSQYVMPPLTTISYPREVLGREAVRILLSKISSKTSDNCNYTEAINFSASIVHRKSVASMQNSNDNK